MKINTALILCAGLGKRLHPLTVTTPKPLLEINNITILETCINTIIKFKDLIDWVWIDTFTKLPLNQNSINILKGFKTCLVCPERWNRPEDIVQYKEKLKKINFQLSAVMTSRHTVKSWV